MPKHLHTRDFRASATIPNYSQIIKTQKLYRNGIKDISMTIIEEVFKLWKEHTEAIKLREQRRETLPEE